MAATATPAMNLAIVRVRATGAGAPLDLDVLARQAGLHPQLVLRLVRMGVVERAGGSARAPLFAAEAPAALARAVRLRRDLGLNYAGAILVGELLDRIDELESRLLRYEPRNDHPR